MQVDFLLEEESAAAALRQLLPRLLPGHTWRLRVFEGCRDLLDQLPQLAQGYRRRMQQPGQQDLRIVVVLDADGIGSRRLQQLESCAAAASLVTWQSAGPGAPFQVLNCLAVQELEAWFLGDPAAIQAAYPRVHPKHFKGLPPDPDTIADAWETLWRVLQKAGLFRAGKAKVTWATAIAPHLKPSRNCSVSFGYFCQGLAALTAISA